MEVIERVRTSIGQAAVEVLEELIWALGDDDAACSEVFVDFTLHLLPAIGPKPGLIRRVGGHEIFARP